MHFGRKIIKLCKKIRNRISSYCNLARLHLYGIRHGNNCCIQGKIFFKLFDSALMSIGDNFYCSSANCINALSTNKRGSFYATHNAIIEIGDNVGMSSPVLWCHNRITIGNNVKLGANCILMDTDAHSLDYKIRHRPDLDGGIALPIVIEDDVLIGVNSIVLKGVTIGARSVIGAGSVVTKNIPPDCIAAGNPAKVIKRLETEIS